MDGSGFVPFRRDEVFEQMRLNYLEAYALGNSVDHGSHHGYNGVVQSQEIDLDAGLSLDDSALGSFSILPSNDFSQHTGGPISPNQLLYNPTAYSQFNPAGSVFPGPTATPNAPAWNPLEVTLPVRPYATGQSTFSPQATSATGYYLNSNGTADQHVQAFGIQSGPVLDQSRLFVNPGPRSVPPSQPPTLTDESRSEPEELMSQPTEQDRSYSTGHVCPHPTCLWSGPKPSDLKKHIATHDKASRCRIPTCDKSGEGQGFSNRNDLTRHEWSVHIIGDGTIFVCTECQPVFTSARSDNFGDHLKRTHDMTHETMKKFRERCKVEKGHPRYEEYKRHCWEKANQPSTGSKRSSPSTRKGTASKRTKTSKASKADMDEILREEPEEEAMSMLGEIESQGAALQSAGGQFGPPTASPNIPQPGIGYLQPQQIPHGMQAPAFTPFRGHLMQYQPILTRMPSNRAHQQRLAFPAALLHQQNLPQQMQQQVPEARDDPSDTIVQHALIPDFPFDPGFQPFAENPSSLPASDDLVQNVSDVLSQVHNLRQPAVMPAIPHSRHQLQSCPDVVVGTNTPRKPKVEYDTHSLASLRHNAKVQAVHQHKCDVCDTTFDLHSKLKKHRDRHNKLWTCLWDDCFNNKQSNGKGTVGDNGLSWAQHGSKDDLRRHEKSIHFDKHQMQGCYRCTGHDDRGIKCQRMFTDDVAFWNHLTQCGYTPEMVHAARQTAYIPADFNGKFWCGFCDDIIVNSPVEELRQHYTRRSGRSAAQAAKESTPHELYIGERREHIRNHIHGGGWQGREGQWKYLNGNGRTKLELDTLHHSAKEGENKAVEKGKGRPRKRSRG